MEINSNLAVDHGRTTYDFAIDLGTTNSVLAVCNQGRVEVVKLEFNNEVTPSAVYVESPGNIIVGRGALPAERGFLNPGRSVREFKRLMGKAVPMQDFPTPRMTGDRDWTAQELATEVLKYIRECYNSQYGEDIRYAVITVPVDFAGAADEATRQAALAAGFTDVRLMQEPAMAAYAYLNHPSIQNQITQQPGSWLVYDLGGGTFDVALLEVQPGEPPRVVDHEGNRELGGKNFDSLICDILVQHVIEQLRADFPNCESDERFPQLKAQLLHIAEEAKIKLSQSRGRNADGSLRIPQVPLPIREQLVLAGFEVRNIRNYTLTYERLTELVKDRIRLSLEICNGLLQRHGLRSPDVKKVLLIGGPTDALYVREALAAAFPGDGRVISIHPFTMVAEGAAIYAQTLRIGVEDPGMNAFWIDWNYDARVSQPNVVVQGTLKAPATHATSLKVQFQNSAGTIRESVVSPEAKFSCDLPLNEGANRFLIRLLKPNGDPVELPEGCGVIDIVYDRTFVDTVQVFPHTLALEIADNRWLPVFRRGEPRSETEIRLKLKTIRESAARERIDFILRAGELTSAKRNLEIGRIFIEPSSPLKEGAQLELTVKPTGDSSFQLKAHALEVTLDGSGEAETTVALKDQPVPSIDELFGSYYDEVGKAIKQCQERCDGILPKLQEKITQLSDFAKQSNGSWDFQLVQRHLREIDAPSLKSRIEEFGSELARIERSRQDVRKRLHESDTGHSLRNAPAEVRKRAGQNLTELLSQCDEIEIALDWIDSKDAEGNLVGELEAVFGHFINRAQTFYVCNQPGQVNATPKELEQWLRVWKNIQEAVRKRDRIELDKFHQEMFLLTLEVGRRSIPFVAAQIQYRHDNIYAKGDLSNKPNSQTAWENIRGSLDPNGNVTSQNVDQLAALLSEFDGQYFNEGGTVLVWDSGRIRPDPKSNSKLEAV